MARRPGPGGSYELPLELPPRLTLFGFTLLPGGGFLELAQAVAVHRDVHLFLLDPSHFDPDVLRRTVPRRSGCARPAPSATSRPGVWRPTRSCSRGVGWQRETALLLAEAEAAGMPTRQWVDEPMSTPPSSLLGRVQGAIRANNGSGGTIPFDPSDRSVQLHACFGPRRQVEALRDTLLHLLDEGAPALTEEDIVVVCPSLERFAPLIEAVFGPSVESSDTPDDGRPTQTGGGAPALRYRIADRSRARPTRAWPPWVLSSTWCPGDSNPPWSSTFWPSVRAPCPVRLRR